MISIRATCRAAKCRAILGREVHPLKLELMNRVVESNEGADDLTCLTGNGQRLSELGKPMRRGVITGKRLWTLIRERSNGIERTIMDHSTKLTIEINNVVLGRSSVIKCRKSDERSERWMSL
jgi:hypothetical protein